MNGPQVMRMLMGCMGLNLVFGLIALLTVSPEPLVASLIVSLMASAAVWTAMAVAK